MIKKILSFVIVTVMILSMIPMVGVSAKGDNPSLDTNKICLDPGHGKNTGATGAMKWGGLQEDHYNLTISNQTKKVLEEHGISVVMTRTSNSYNPSFAERAATAVNNGAGTLVSIHNNSSDSSSANGCGAFITNDKYLPNHAARSSSLGDAILTRLTNDVGIRRWEMYSVNGSMRYPDGSVADYYGILRQSKMHWLNASVIIECVFQSNYNDVHNYLLNPAKLTEMGTAIANGIMDAYNIGQVKEEQYFNNIDTSPTTCLNGSELVVKMSRSLIKGVDTELSVSGWSVHKEGVAKYQYQIDSNGWKDLNGWFRQDVADVAIAYTNCSTLNAFQQNIDISSIAIGKATLKIRGVTKENNTYEIAEYFIFMNPTPGTTSMTTNKDKYTLDEPIKITATGVIEGAWVGLFGMDDVPGTVSSYCWFEMHNGTVTLNDFLKEGIYNSRGDVTPGTYRILTFVDSGYNVDPNVPEKTITILPRKEFSVDAPGADVTDMTLEAGDSIHLAGWSVHPEGIASFELVVDGTSRTKLNKTTRGDIFAAFPSYESACADLYAFAHNFSTSAVALGTHNAEIVVTTKTGETYVIKTFKFTVTPPAYDGKLTAIESGITVDRTGDKVKVTGVTEMLDASTVAAMFDGDCRITKADGSALTDGYVGSGCIINLYFGEKIYDSAIIIVKADIDGDGIVTGKDVIRAKKVMSDISVDGYSEAGDINGDGVITDTDISFIASSCIK